MTDNILNAVKKLKLILDKHQIDLNELKSTISIKENVGVAQTMADIADKIKNYTIENGNWHFNGKDTGVPAAAKDGYTPVKGKDYKDGINGKDGYNGKDGKDGRNGIDGKDGKDGTNGKDGLSAYEIAVKNGYKGSEKKWLESLKAELESNVIAILNRKTRGGGIGVGAVSGGTVTSVNTVEPVLGDVTLTTDNITDTATNRYTSDTDITRLANTSGTNTGDQDLSPYLLISNNHDIPSGGSANDKLVKIDGTDYNTQWTANQDQSGFDDPTLVTISYNSTTRKVTLTGTFNVYWKGILVTELTNGWESAAHDDINGAWFLLYNGTAFVWQQTAWTFDLIQIAYIYYGVNDKLAIRECHSLMDWRAHAEFHDVQGTYRQSGGTLSGYTLNSTTAAERRPLVSSCLLKDEDLQTTNPALSTEIYTRFHFTSTSTPNFTLDDTDIVALSTNQPYWNEFTGGSWQQTLMTNNSYMCIWLIAIPTTSDSTSQKYRFVWLQGQSEGTLASQEALAPSNLTLTGFITIPSEYVFISKVIIRYTASNWVVSEVSDITTSRVEQSSSSGLFLSVVEHDATLTGLGTSASPLGVTTGTYEPVITVGTTSQYWRGDKSFQTLDKTAVGLGNVDNTSDANKPVSSATQTALNLKLDSSTYTASDVLTKIKTVDGSGSGLDADLLDGLSSAAFATAAQGAKADLFAQSGFDYPDLVVQNYDNSTRQVTLSGTGWKFYWKGTEVTAVTNGWVSDAHTATAGGWWHYYNGSAFVWEQTVTAEDIATISFAYYGTAAAYRFGIRECHSLLDWRAHRIFQHTLGPYRLSGGVLSGYTLGSTTLANRRPLISATTVYDDDLKTVIPALSTETYTRFYTSSTSTVNLEVDVADIVPLSTNRPYYNKITGTTFSQVLMTSGLYQTIWVLAIPVMADATSQKLRYIFMQGQSEGTLAAQQALTTANVNVTGLIQITDAYVFIAKMIILYNGTNWVVSQVDAIATIKPQQVNGGSSYPPPPSGGETLPSTIDSSLEGDGTAESPLGVSAYVPMYEGTTTNVGDAYSITTTTTAFSALTVGYGFSFLANASSTGAATLNPNTLGAIPLKKPNGSDATLIANSIYTVRYNGTNFILQGEGSSGDALASDLRLGKTASSDVGDIIGTLMVPSADSYDYVIDTGETIVARDLVTLFDDKVKNAFRRLEGEEPKATISGVTAGGTAGSRNFDVCTCSETHAVVCFRNASDSNTGYAVVALRTGDTISYGAVKQFETGAVSEISVCSPNDTNKACVFYKDEGNSNQVTACAMTFNITTLVITTGTPLVVDTDTTTNGLSITPLDVDVVLCVWTGTADNGQAVVLTIATRTLTKEGTQYQYNAGQDLENVVVTLSSTLAMVLYQNTTTDLRARCLSIDGSYNVTGGTDKQVVATNNSKIGLCAMGADKAFAIYTDATNDETTCQILTVSGTTITAQTAYTLGFDLYDYKSVKPQLVSDTEVLVTIAKGKTLLGVIFNADLSTHVITRGDVVFIEGDNRNESAIANFMDTRFICLFANNASDLLNTEVLTYYHMAHGYALADGTATETIGCVDWR